MARTPWWFRWYFFIKKKLLRRIIFNRTCLNAELWCFTCCLAEQTVEQTVDLIVTSDAMASMWRHRTSSHNLHSVKLFNTILWIQSCCKQSMSPLCHMWIQKLHDHWQYIRMRSSFRLWQPFCGDSDATSPASVLCLQWCHHMFTWIK